MDCGLAYFGCPSAYNKICLMQRGGNLYCQKILHCMAAGGIAAIIYGRDDEASCWPTDSIGLQGGCSSPAGGYVPTLGMARGQGQLLRGMLASGPVTLTISVFDAYAGRWGYMSGTSMATPHASAVAGLVWAAYPGCSNAEIRQALRASALDLGAPGRDDEYGWGLVQARAAHDWLSAHPCQGAMVEITGTPSASQRSVVRPFMAVISGLMVQPSGLISMLWVSVGSIASSVRIRVIPHKRGCVGASAGSLKSNRPEPSVSITA